MGRNLSSAISIRINAGLDKFRPIGNLAGYEGMEPKHSLNSGFEARGGWTEGGCRTRRSIGHRFAMAISTCPPSVGSPPSTLDTSADTTTTGGVVAPGDLPL